MILLEKIIRIDFGKAPFTHDWIITDPCLTVQSSEIKNENGQHILYAIFEAYNEQCIDNLESIKLYLEDSSTVPCKREFEIGVESPCEDIEFLYKTGIARTDSLTFHAPIIKKNSPYKYEWDFNDSLFDIFEQKDDSIKLKLKEKIYVKESFQSSISVTITDKWQCSVTRDFVFSVASPTRDEGVIIETLCTEDGLITTNNINIPVSPAYVEIQECFTEPCVTNISIETICEVDTKSIKLTGLQVGCPIQLLKNGEIIRSSVASLVGEVTFIQLEAGIYTLHSPDCDDCIFDEEIYLCTDNNSKFKEVPINWNTLNLVVPSGITWKNIGEGKVKIDFPSAYIGENVTVVYFVEDVNGVRVKGEFCVQVNSCSSGLLIPDFNSIIGCTECQQDILSGLLPEDSGICNDSIITISLEDRLQNLDINWNSIEFIPLDGQVLGVNKIAGKHDFTVELDKNRNIIISPIYSTFGTEYFEEKVRLKIKNNSGKSAIFNLNIEKSTCEDEVIPVDDSICLVAGETLSRYNVTNNDINLQEVESFVITQFPSASLGDFSVNVDGLVTIVSSPTASGEYSFKYKVNNSTQEGTVTIQVINNSETNYTYSYCTSETSMIDLFNLLVDVTDQSGYWIYRGKKESLLDLSYSAGTLKVQNDDYASYLNRSKLTNSGTYNLVVGLDRDPGFHSFVYILGDYPCAIENEIILESKNKIALPNEYETGICKDDPKFDLSNLTYGEGVLGDVLPGNGVWFNTVPGTLTGSEFIPKDNNAGTYKWTYTVPNEGEYNSICDSVFNLTITLDSVKYAGEDACVKVCSDGPELGDPNFACRTEGDLQKKYNGSAGCEICLDDKLGSDPEKTITEGGKWILTCAPYSTNVPLFINGRVYFRDVYDPENPNQKEEDYTLPNNPCIDFSHLDLGDYEFKYIVGDICVDEATLIVSVFPAPCEVEDIEVTFCGTRPETTLYELLLELLPDSEDCVPSPYGNWEDVSLIPVNPGVLHLSNDDDGKNDRITPELVLPPDAEFGDDRTVSLIYTYFPDFAESRVCTQEGCEAECETCFKQVRLDLIFSKSQEQGQARNLTTCHGDGECGILLYDRLIDSVVDGEWFYVGCNGLNKENVDPNCNIGLQVGGVTKYPNRDFSIGDHTLEIDFSSATIGFYWFEYVYCNDDGCCVTTPLIIQVVDLLNPGEDNTCELCLDPSSPLCINLFRTLGGTPYAGGTWENTNSSATIAVTGCNGITSCGDPTSSTAGGFFDDSGGTGQNATFNTLNQNRGTHVFEYTVYDPPAEFEIDKSLCPACSNPSATVTVNLDEGTCLGDVNHYAICTDSCITNIFDRLEACVGDTIQDIEGGTWTYDGCNLIDNTGPDGACAEAVTVPAGDRISIDLDGKPEGFYYFTYTICNGDGECCSDLQLIVQVVEELCAGGDEECTVCSADPECIDLFEMLDNTSTCGVVDTGGKWENLDGAPVAGGACTGNGNPLECGEETDTGSGGFFDNAGGNNGSTVATFNSDGVPAGTYRFKYTVTDPPTEYEYNPEECPNCTIGMGFVTITVHEPDGPGDPETGVNVCNS